MGPMVDEILSKKAATFGDENPKFTPVRNVFYVDSNSIEIYF